MRKINYLLIIAFLLSAGIAGILMTLPIGAVDTADPDTYVVTLYKTELSTDGINWVTVFDNGAIGVPLNLKNPAEAGTAFGQGSLPAGIYTNMRFKIKNEITFTKVISSINSSFVPYPGLGTEVTVYFSNTSPGETASFTWANNGTINAPFPLPDPIRVVVGATSKIIINFGVTNSLVYYGSDWILNPPVISIGNVVIGAGVGFQGGEYHFVRQNLRLPVGATITDTTITPTYMSMQSGGGTINMIPSLTDPSAGTFVINAGAMWEQEEWIQSGSPIQIGVELENNSEEISGRYYVDAEGYLNMLMPNTEGIIRGAVRDDGYVFVAIEIASPSSTTEYSSIGYHIIYAVKKITDTAGSWEGNYAFNGYANEIFTATSGGNLNPSLFYLENHLSIGWLDAQTNAITITESTNRIQINRPLSWTEQTVNAPVVAYYGPATDSVGFTYTNVGRFDIPDGDFNGSTWGAMLMDTDRTIGIMADGGIPYDIYSFGPDEYTQNRIDFGVALKIRPAGYWVTNKAQLAGTYSFVYRGDWWENTMGNRLPGNNVMLGRLTLNPMGTVTGTTTGRAIQCERGQIRIQDLSAITYTVTTVPLGINPDDPINFGMVEGTDYYNTDMLVFYDTIEQREVVRLLIGWDGKTLAPYSPIGTDELPNRERGLGLAVKQK